MISAIVLAAGHSRRMGTQKLLLPVRGEPMIAVVVDELLHSPVDEVIVVTGKAGSAVGAALADCDVRLVVNADQDSEMLQSVRCGLTAVSADAEAVVIALGDQPAITTDVVGELIRAYHSTGHRIVVPKYEGKRGHPLLISMRHRDEILEYYTGRGLRGVLETHPEEVFELEVNDAGVLEDIDVPEDYRRAVSRNQIT
jgi:molybdenum cofactor cytidylyltransferase